MGALGKSSIEWRYHLCCPRKGHIPVSAVRFRCYRTIMPKIPAPTEAALMSSKHSFRLFLTNTMMSIPTSCLEASYQSARGWITFRLL